ncbi:MAG TPA: M48 family metallopeptidase [Pseudomonadales bacterium]|nr:M48 family metallopeptidase [Pseudomonadales bacterium]
MKRLFLLVVIVLAVAGCATSPTGRSQLMMVSDDQMAASGQQMFAQMKQKDTVVQDRVMSEEVYCIVNDLLAQLPANWQSGWEVQVFEDKTANAFALPGRKIGVNTGIIKLVKNDSQLATVIGHEIGHVIARHANERASMGMLSQIGQEVAGQINPAGAAVFGLGAQVGIMLPYSRTHEAEADVIGQNLMAKAGFDPRESISLWKLMAKQGGDKPPELLSTHPANASRIEGLTAHLSVTMPMYQQAQAAGRRPHCSS